MAKSFVLSLSLCLFILFHGCLTLARQYKLDEGYIQLRRRQFQGEQQQSECQINNLDALEPSRRIEAEAGRLEIWDGNNEQFRCAGVAAYRVTIQPKGLSLPVYQNTPQIIYIVQGRGVLGLSIPGCPETFQSSFEQYQQSEEGEEDDEAYSSSQGSKDQGGKSQQSKDPSSRSQESEDQHSRHQGSKSQQSKDQSSRSQRSEDEDPDQQSGRQGSKSQQSEDQSSRSQRSKSQQSEDQSSRSQQRSHDQHSRSQRSQDQHSRSQRSKSQQSEDQSSRSQQRSHDQHSRSQRSGDFYQKLRFFKEKDILFVPQGVAYWAYNDGDTPTVAISIIDIRNDFNQLDDEVRNFWLAGNVQDQDQDQDQEEQQQQQQKQKQKQRRSSSSRSEKVGQQSSSSVFSGFDTEILAQAFGVTKKTVRKLQGENDQRGPIIQVERELRVIRSILSDEEDERQQEKNTNGLEEGLCNMRLTHNIGKATSSDVYTPFGGRVATLNSQSLPILGYYQLSAERGHLYKNALLSPHWNINAHSVMYVIRGEARVQIVGNSGQTVFDGQLCEGQLVIVPQNFVVVKQAGDNGFEWVSVKTSDNAMTSPLVGRTSAIRAMPEEVLMHSYQISREEARKLKYNREEMSILSPNFESIDGKFSMI
ncbi:PREDICTED: 11S globulin subunit beta-like [Nelumbo nucifera]|uniref:11S globulin subunit beta-like n=1 Tax=Nelumbo nucifera TaxID=4432 RepID=A0A1U8BGW9_NELNU|nr:PREDICTED: 11S globulin subunit beta-like [Nelumbo nucifera]